MKSAITISLVPEATGGPFVFWHDLEKAGARAAELGFDALEVFPPGVEFDHALLRRVLEQNKLKLAALGSGAGWVKHKLTLTSPDRSTREKGLDWIKGVISLAATFDAPAILGSMQGRVEPGMHRSEVMSRLRDAVEALAAHAAEQKQILLLEPLNRYETNVLSTVQQGLEFLGGLQSKNIKLLLDLFHMNIEEQNLAASIRLAGPAVGHIHLADSNRRAAGLGHMDFKPIIAALREINYQGYLSGEVHPLPHPDDAASQTIAAFKALTQ